jgi:hypothetical protein
MKKMKFCIGPHWTNGKDVPVEKLAEWKEWRPKKKRKSIHPKAFLRGGKCSPRYLYGKDIPR